MAAGDDLEKFHCLCRAVILRANRRGIELHCDRCQRRQLIPFESLRNKESLDRYWREWRAGQKRA